MNARETGQQEEARMLLDVADAREKGLVVMRFWSGCAESSTPRANRPIWRVDAQRTASLYSTRSSHAVHCSHRFSSFFFSFWCMFITRSPSDWLFLFLAFYKQPTISVPLLPSERHPPKNRASAPDFSGISSPAHFVSILWHQSHPPSASTSLQSCADEKHSFALLVVIFMTAT